MDLDANSQNVTSKAKRGRPPKQSQAQVESVAQVDINKSFEVNSYGVSWVFGDFIDTGHSREQINQYLKDPMFNNKELRELAWWAYRTNGSVTSAIDYIKTMHTLDKIIVCKNSTVGGKQPESFKQNRKKLSAVLDSIKYKQIIRDAIFRNANDGVSFYYFETTTILANNTKFLSDVDVYNIAEINEVGINAAVIPLPVDWCKIVGRKNSSYVIAFDLRYFRQFINDKELERKLKTFPSEIRNGWHTFSKGDNEQNCWLILDNSKTIVTKIKSAISDPWGIPMVIAALDDVLYAEYFIKTKRNILSNINNNIVYQTFPEGKEKGLSALTNAQQEDQHNTVKKAILNKSENSSGTSFFSLAAGTKVDQLTVDISLFDEKNESTVNDNVAGGLGIASSSLNGNSKGNYATATLNLELVAGNIYSWIEEFINELNKCVNANIIKDKNCRVEAYILPTTYVNRDKIIQHMSDLYSKGKGSLIAWISSIGVDPDAYLSLLDYELEMDLENKYPVHKTSFTISSKDAIPSDTDHSGAPKIDNPTNQSTIQTRSNNSNSNPKPST